MSNWGQSPQHRAHLGTIPWRGRSWVSIPLPWLVGQSLLPGARSSRVSSLHSMENTLGWRGAGPCRGNYPYYHHLKYTISHPHNRTELFVGCVWVTTGSMGLHHCPMQSFTLYTPTTTVFIQPREAGGPAICTSQMGKLRHRDAITFLRSSSWHVNKIYENSYSDIT